MKRAGRALAATALLIALGAAGPVCDAVWHDGARNRDVAVRIRMPDTTSAARAPVVLWSPGLGGDIATGSGWAQRFAEAGLGVVQMQHPGSDSAVYAGLVPRETRRAMVAEATSPAQVAARVGDAGFVLDELGRRRVEGACDLTRLDPGKAAIAGHSMGAWTATAIAGQRFDSRPSLRDRRFRAALAMSPTAPPGSDPTLAFGRISIPMMVVTGSEDGVPPGADADTRAAALAARTGAYLGAPADGHDYLLVIADADHAMFAGNSPGTAPAPVAQHVRAVVGRLATAFLTAYLRNDRSARATIDTTRPDGLDPADRFERK